MRAIIIILLFGLFSTATYAQTIQSSQLTGKTWYVDEFYADSVRIDSTIFSSLQFTFLSSNQFSVTGVDASGVQSTTQGSWATNTNQTQLILTSSGTQQASAQTASLAGQSTLDVTYLDPNVLAFVTRVTDSNTGTEVIVELRLRPVSY